MSCLETKSATSITFRGGAFDLKFQILTAHTAATRASAIALLTKGRDFIIGENFAAEQREIGRVVLAVTIQMSGFGALIDNDEVVGILGAGRAMSTGDLVPLLVGVIARFVPDPAPTLPKSPVTNLLSVSYGFSLCGESTVIKIQSEHP